MASDVDLEDLEKKLLTWIADWNEGEYTGELNAQTDLFSAGVLDSMGFTGLIAYLEDETGIEFDFEKAQDSDASSLRDLLGLCFPESPAAA